MEEKKLIVPRIFEGFSFQQQKIIRNKSFDQLPENWQKIITDNVNKREVSQCNA